MVTPTSSLISLVGFRGQESRIFGPYYQRARCLMEQFPTKNLEHIARGQNSWPDGLPGLAAALSTLEGGSFAASVCERLHYSVCPV